MALTKTAVTAAGDTSPKKSPNSITTVSTYVRPSDQSSWTPSAPYVLYTAPSTCKYARIVIPYKMRSSSTSYSTEAFQIQGGSSNNYWIGLAIVNDTNSTTDNIVRGYSASQSYGVSFNYFQSNGQYDDPGISITNTFDVVANFQASNYNNFFIIPEERWVLNPGEKLVAPTGNTNMDQYIFANFEAWVYN